MIKTVDIAHAGQSSSEALVLLEVAISTAKEEGVVAVKIIHGLGSGSIAEKVRLWAKEQEGRFRAVIPGEDYNTFNKDAVENPADLPGGEGFGGLLTPSIGLGNVLIKRLKNIGVVFEEIPLNN